MEPQHYNTPDAEERVRRLAKTYGIDEAAAASQWRLSHHLVPATASVHEAFRLLPHTYTELRRLYNGVS